jgi:hypothetical protein
MTSSDNSGGLSRMAVDPTLGGLRDGTDFPHSGIFHALNIASRGSYAILDGNNFDITQSDSSGNTQFVVAAGRVFRDGEYLAEIATATFTQGTPSNFDEPNSGNMYYLLVVNSSNALEMKNHGSLTAVDIVPVPAAGDIPIAVIRLGASETVTQRHVQFLTTGKTKNTISIGYDSSGYNETGKITGTSSQLHIQATGTNTDVKLTPTGTGDILLGGDVDVNGNDIISTTTNQNITIAPNGTGQVVIGNQSQTVNRLSSNGARDLKLEANSGVGASITLGDGANGGISITPNGSGEINLGTLPTATVATDDKVVIEDTSDSDDLKTVTTQSIANLYSETDTLADVTGRGATTSTSLNLNGIVNFGNDITHDKNASPHNAATLLTLGATMIYLDDATGTAQLPDPNSHTDKVVTIKNVNPTTLSITPLVGTIDNGVVNHDKRVTVANTIKLLQGESVTVQAIADGGISGGPTTVTQGWYVADTDSDTDTGITDVVDDTTPQLGGDLDVNGSKIISASNGDVEIEPHGTGDIILDGDVSVDTAHSFIAAKLPTATKTTSTLSNSDAGKYLFVSTTGQTITLPASPVAGEHYTILANGYDVTLSSSDNMNGSSDDITISSYSGVTCISDGTNWIVLGA